MPSLPIVMAALAAGVIAACGTPVGPGSVTTVVVPSASSSAPRGLGVAQSMPERGADVVILIDMSGSMRARATWRGAGHATRLDAAKDVASEIVSLRKVDRIGLVVFGASAFVLAPSTLDHQALETLIRAMELGQIDPAGTAVGAAITTAQKRLEKRNEKAIVLITDGHCGSEESARAEATQAIDAARSAKASGVRLAVVQVSDDDEVLVADGVDLFGKPHTVRMAFPVNRELWKRISEETGAMHLVMPERADLKSELRALLDFR